MSVFPSSVDGQTTRAQLAKNGGNRKCPEIFHLRSEQAGWTRRWHIRSWNAGELLDVVNTFGGGEDGADVSNGGLVGKAGFCRMRCERTDGCSDSLGGGLLARSVEAWEFYVGRRVDLFRRHFRRSVCGREGWRHPIEVRDGGLHVAVLMWPILDQVLVLRYS